MTNHCESWRGSAYAFLADSTLCVSLFCDEVSSIVIGFKCQPLLETQRFYINSADKEPSQLLEASHYLWRGLAPKRNGLGEQNYE
jgi:hypothetical protein